MQFKGLQKIKVAGAQGVAQIVQKERALACGLQIKLIGIVVMLCFHVVFARTGDIVHAEAGIGHVFGMIHLEMFLLSRDDENRMGSLF